MASSSSTVADAEHHHHHEAELSTLPSPPPPTPSGQSLAPSNADDTLSRLLHRLLIAPNLSSASLSRRLRTSPLISFLHRQQDLLLSAATNHGFFHLTDHAIPSHLPAAALTEAQSLLSTTPPSSTRNLFCLGFKADEAEEAEDTYQVFDVGTADLDGTPALREYSRCLEKVGLEVVDMLVGSWGLAENPFVEGRLRPRCLMWISSSSSEPMDEMKSYPYVVCLQYQVKRAYRVLDGDSGSWIPVKPTLDSILVMLGDIAQVWSNGRFKKARGVPQQTFHENFDNDNHVSLSLLVTLPMDTIVSPIFSVLSESHNECGDKEIDDNNKKYHTFSFHEYAWKLYHRELSLKDPLLIYQN